MYVSYPQTEIPPAMFVPGLRLHAGPACGLSDASQAQPVVLLNPQPPPADPLSFLTSSAQVNPTLLIGGVVLALIAVYFLGGKHEPERAKRKATRKSIETKMEKLRKQLDEL